MRLPDELLRALTKKIASLPHNALSMASKELTQRYRSHDRDKTSAFMSTDAHRLAYLAVRMPATFAVVCRVLCEVKNRLPSFSPQSLADIGAGPGTAAWSAISTYPEISKLTLYEKDAAMLNIGQELMSQADQPVLQKASWQPSDLQHWTTSTSAHDLSILSYVIGELPLDTIPALVSKIWGSTSQVLVVIEPGTPHGFERIRVARAHLLQCGANLVAPCPHHNACPMPKNDWCHFSQRLERSTIHMSIKDVAMGYEDEKFSYVVATKLPVELSTERILRHPQSHSGHIVFTLCTNDGVEQRTISRRHKELYKQARKLNWGDLFPKNYVFNLQDGNDGKDKAIRV